jgi:putative intracellular protease/amidase
MRLLILMTKASELTLGDGTKYPSGFWAEEFAVPYRLFIERGYDVDIGTVGGMRPSVDRSSLDPNNLQYVRPAGSKVDDAAKAEEWARTIETAPELQRPIAVEAINRADLQAYDGVYMCGGHGCMEDQPTSAAMGNLTLWTHELSLPVAAVCHGHSAMLSARDAHGKFPYAGYRMTAFSHNEERVTPIYGRLPLILEDELRQRGIEYSEAPLLWDAHVVTDRNLVTGQNPFSSNLLAETFLHGLALARAQAMAAGGGSRTV